MDEKDSYDAIVIGSGMGGLTAAAVLARIKNYRVLVLEQNFKLGGFTHTFQRPGGYSWDVGLHYVGEMNRGNPLRRIMDFITQGEVDWIAMKDPFEVFLYPGLTFEVPSNRKDYLDRLENLFPTESASLERYFRDVDTAANDLQGRSPLPSSSDEKKPSITGRDMALQTLKAYLDSHFQDHRLKGLLASQWGDYGLPPKLSSFGVHAIIVRHYLNGGYYPVGSLSKAMERVVRSTGGDLKVRHRVRRILVEQGKAVGVEVETLQGIKTFLALEIYSDAGAENTFTKLLSGAACDPAELQAFSSEGGYGVATLYLGLKSRCEPLGVHGQNFWIFDDFDHDSIWERRNLLAEGVASSCYLSFPGIKDPLAKRPTAELIAPLDHQIFHSWAGTKWKRRGSDYGKLKTMITQSLLNFVEDRIPGFQNEVAYAELSTPLSVEHFTGHRGGAIYGFPGTPRRYGLMSLKPKTSLPGLLLVGADAGNHGIAGAMMGGVRGVAARHGSKILMELFKNG